MVLPVPHSPLLKTSIQFPDPLYFSPVSSAYSHRLLQAVTAPVRGTQKLPRGEKRSPAWYPQGKAGPHHWSVYFGRGSFQSEGTWSQGQFASSVLGWGPAPGVVDRMNLEHHKLGHLKKKAGPRHPQKGYTPGLSFPIGWSFGHLINGPTQRLIN